MLLHFTNQTKQHVCVDKKNVLTKCKTNCLRPLVHLKADRPKKIYTPSLPQKGQCCKAKTTRQKNLKFWFKLSKGYL